MKIRLSGPAKADLAEIRRYIADNNPRAAAEVIRALRDTLRNTISRFPLVGKSCDDLAPGLRSCPVGSYVLFYFVGTSVDVVRVLHGAREFGPIFHD